MSVTLKVCFDLLLILAWELLKICAFQIHPTEMGCFLVNRTQQAPLLVATPRWLKRFAAERERLVASCLPRSGWGSCSRRWAFGVCLFVGGGCMIRGQKLVYRAYRVCCVEVVLRWGGPSSGLYLGESFNQVSPRAYLNFPGGPRPGPLSNAHQDPSFRGSIAKACCMIPNYQYIGLERTNTTNDCNTGTMGLYGRLFLELWIDERVLDIGQQQILRPNPGRP